jgi:hypothetical protein
MANRIRLVSAFDYQSGATAPKQSIRFSEMGTASPTFNLISSENLENMNVYDSNPIPS